MDKEEFRRQLVAARKARKLSQHDLGRMVDVEQSAVTQWETGKTTPARDRVFAIEYALGLRQGTLAQFLGFGPARGTAVTFRQVTVTDAILADEKLTPNQRQLLIALYRELTILSRGHVQRPSRAWDDEDRADGDAAPASGRGLWLMGRLVDEVRLERIHPHGTRVTLRRRVGVPAERKPGNQSATGPTKV